MWDLGSGRSPRSTGESSQMGQGTKLHCTHVLLLGQDCQVLGHKVRKKSIVSANNLAQMIGSVYASTNIKIV